MALTMPYSSNEQSLPYLVDPSGTPYATTEQLGDGVWLFENPFFPGQPVTPAGFGLGTGTGTGTGTGVGVGVGMRTGAGMGGGATANGGSWNNGVDADPSLSMGAHAWNGAGLMEISNQPSPLDFPFPSSSTSQSASAPPFSSPFYGMSHSGGSTGDPNVFGGMDMPQHWETPGMGPVPLDLTTFTNFPSRPIPTGARYDQLLQAKLGSPPDPASLAAAAAITTPISSFTSTLPTGDAMAYKYAQPRYDGGSRGPTAPPSLATTPNLIVPSQSTLPVPLALPLSAIAPGSYPSSTSTTSSPTNLPASHPILNAQQQMQMQMQQGIHFHPSPLSLPTGVNYYRIVDPQLAQQAAFLPGVEVSSGDYSSMIPVAGTPSWQASQQQSRSRQPSRTPTPFREVEAGPSRSNTYPFAGPSSSAPSLHHSNSQPIPLVTQNSDPQLPQLRSSPISFYGWNQPAGAPPTPQPTAMRDQSYHWDQHHQTRVQTLAHHHLHPLPPLPQSYHSTFTSQYPSAVSQYSKPDLANPMYQSWTSSMSSDPSGDRPSASTPSTTERPTIALNAVHNLSRSRSASSFIQPAASAPGSPQRGSSELQDVGDMPPQMAQRKRRKYKSSDSLRPPAVDNYGRERKPDRGEPQGAEEEERKVVIACHTCRAKKLRCDGVRPRCHNCERKDEETCSYDVRLKRRGQGKKTKEKIMQELRTSGGRSVSSTSARSGGRRASRSKAANGAGTTDDWRQSSPSTSRAASPSAARGGVPSSGMAVKVEEA